MKEEEERKQTGDEITMQRKRGERKYDKAGNTVKEKRKVKQ